jgi:hypothetical protein
MLFYLQFFTMRKAAQEALLSRFPGKFLVAQPFVHI